MTLRVAVQMDPLERINIAGDSTFAIMLKAQELGHQLYLLCAGRPELTPRGGCGRWAIRSRSSASKAITYRFGELAHPRSRPRRRRRPDAAGPAFDLGYITATHLLERIQGETLGGQRPGSGPQRAREALGARLRAVHAADGDHPLARRSRASSSPSMATSSSSRCTALPADRCSGSAATGAISPR